MAGSVAADDPSASERERLALLRRYAILDTGPEPEFDELVAQAAKETGYPTALLSLMDANRCWFKAATGLLPDDTDIRELPRSQTFCDHAFRSSGTFVVPDARADQRFARLAVVARPRGYRAYAGAQIISADGHSLGTVCVLDERPREPDEQQRAALRRFADRAMSLLEARARRLAAKATPSRPLAVVADDDSYVRIVAAEMLKHLGFAVAEAGDGKTALELCRQHGTEVQLVLTDLNMPGADGLALARALLTEPHRPTVVMMSGQFDGRIRAAALAAGVSLLLTKPFTLEALRNAAATAAC